MHPSVKCAEEKQWGLLKEAKTRGHNQQNVHKEAACPVLKQDVESAD